MELKISQKIIYGSDGITSVGTEIHTCNFNLSATIKQDCLTTNQHWLTAFDFFLFFCYEFLEGYSWKIPVAACFHVGGMLTIS